MSTTITLAQYTAAFALSQQGQTTAAWQALAANGDMYAVAAAQVTGDPASTLSEIAHNTWAAAGADPSKFDTVAAAYQTLYLESVLGGAKGDGTFSLPSSTLIEQDEPRRVSRRLFGLSHAAMSGCSSIA
jgi:hypothetical protein